MSNVLPIPLAQFGEDGPNIYLVLGALALVAIVVVFFLLLVNRFKRCPSNRVLVIYGKVGGGNTARCIHGGAAFVMPLI